VFLTSSAFALGFLHGLGADHLMAIAALSVGSPTPATRSRTFRVAVSFAAGHALLLAIGSAVVVVAGWTIPVLVERTGEIAGGAILMLLGAAGLWMAATERMYGHRHAHGSRLHIGEHSHWHLHVGSRAHHPQPQRHSHLPTILGAAFAVSGLRALTMLAPFGGRPADISLVTLLGLVLIFAAGILLSMSLFGIVLARTLGTPRIAAIAGRAAATVTAVASVALGAYWVFWRT
jgi:nickel/cobalt transporter (NicO) family protein